MSDISYMLIVFMVLVDEWLGRERNC